MAEDLKHRPIREAVDRVITPPRIAFTAGVSLFMEKPTNPTVRRKTLYDELAAASTPEALNEADEIPVKFLSVLDRRQISVGSILVDRNPYWMPDTPYNMLEVVGTSMQFFDHHSAPLPRTTLPPVKDLEAFIGRVLDQPEALTVDQQFNMLLDITGNNIIGAVHLGMLATRYMSRFADGRAYPSVVIEGKTYTAETPDEEISEMIRKCNSRTARFVTNNEHGMNDGLGDSYYFWTHLFGSLVLNLNGAHAKAMEKIFEHGTELMIFAKYTIARRSGNILPHREASQAGRDVGLELIEKAQEERRETRRKSRREINVN